MGSVPFMASSNRPTAASEAGRSRTPSSNTTATASLRTHPINSSKNLEAYFAENETYQLVSNAVRLLEHQLEQARADLRKLSMIKVTALEEPLEFLQRCKKDSIERLPRLQKIVPIPRVSADLLLKSARSLSNSPRPTRPRERNIDIKACDVKGEKPRIRRKPVPIAMSPLSRVTDSVSRTIGTPDENAAKKKKRRTNADESSTKRKRRKPSSLKVDKTGNAEFLANGAHLPPFPPFLALAPPGVTGTVPHVAPVPPGGVRPPGLPGQPSPFPDPATLSSYVKSNDATGDGHMSIMDSLAALSMFGPAGIMANPGLVAATTQKAGLKTEERGNSPSVPDETLSKSQSLNGYRNNEPVGRPSHVNGTRRASASEVMVKPNEKTSGDSELTPEAPASTAANNDKSSTAKALTPTCESVVSLEEGSKLGFGSNQAASVNPQLGKESDGPSRVSKVSKKSSGDSTPSSPPHEAPNVPGGSQAKSFGREIISNGKMKPKKSASEGEVLDPRVPILPSDAKNTTIHLGFRCDNCQVEPIVGVRFTCKTCPLEHSVDLCSICITMKPPFTNDLHTCEHEFTRYSEAEIPYYDVAYYAALAAQAERRVN